MIRERRSDKGEEGGRESDRRKGGQGKGGGEDIYTCTLVLDGGENVIV